MGEDIDPWVHGLGQVTVGDGGRGGGVKSLNMSLALTLPFGREIGWLCSKRLIFS